jgi:DNA-binding CsgD family transcriptional regulator
MELAEEIGIRDPGVTRFVPDAVEALVELGRPSEAETALTGFAETAKRLGYPWALATVDRCRGLIRLATGDAEGALATLEQACTAYEPLPLPLERARTLLALGATQRRARQRKAARATLQRALGLFEEIGASLWAEKTKAELARIGGRAAAANGLTPSEQRIAALVGKGKTNQEVAVALVISRRTVESALTQIYRKLDVRSRTELARKLSDST